LSYFLNLFELVKDILLPPLCVVCGKINPDYLCSECDLKIKIFGGAVCDRCGKPLNMDESGEFNHGFKFCSLCNNENYYFYKARSYCIYEGAAAKIIHKYKYKGYEYISKILAQFLEKAYKNYYSNEEIDFIDTVPDYSGTYHSLRYFSVNRYQSDTSISGSMIRNNAAGNHMQTLALLFSKFTGIPFSNNIIKIKETPKQQKLDRNSRKVNLYEAFKVKNCFLVYGKNFLIIDDVWTTGSTLNEISSILKKSGANKIFLLTLARPV